MAERDPWTIDEADFPKDGSPSEKLQFLLNYAILAPSSHNTQPWLFKVKGSAVELYADRTRALPVADPEDRELIISCGAALYNLRVAISHFGYAYTEELLPDPANPDILATVELGGRSEVFKEDAEIFIAIRNRLTNRAAFEQRPLPAGFISEIQKAASLEGAWLAEVKDMEARIGVADLIAEGDRIQARSSLFRRELASWVHSNRTRSHDGMPGYAFGISDTASYAGPMLIRTFDWGQGQAARDRQLAEGSPLLTVLCSETDEPASWISAGQALERIVLLACAGGIWVSYLNQPIEVSSLRSRLRGILNVQGFPQLILRMGYGPAARHTPRRPLNEVLL
ncbi:MAG: nitroreductase [Deltaproteobacteria bacterium]|nr:nitroreductase [Deltaproteobacteria bacterium]